MAKTIKFKNGATIPYVDAREEPTYFDGAQRRCLTVYFAPEAITLAKLNEFASNPANLSSLLFTNDDNAPTIISNVYDNYTVKMKVSLEPVTRGYDPVTGAETFVEQVILQLARLTPLEIQVAQLLAKSAPV